MKHIQKYRKKYLKFIKYKKGAPMRSHELFRKYLDLINENSEELSEKWGVQTTVSPEEKGKYSGKSKEELLKSYRELKKSGPHKKGSPEYSRMRELAFAIRAKSGWGKVGY